MRDERGYEAALALALAEPEDARGQDGDASVDRILAAAFFRKRPLQAGSAAPKSNVIRLADRIERRDFLSVRGGFRR